MDELQLKTKQDPKLQHTLLWNLD